MTAARTQKALLLPAQGAQWQLGESLIPTPGPKDVLVKLAATALNPVDWKVRSTYSFLVSSYPHVGGTDGAGVIEEVGAEVSNFAKGDRVLFQGWFENSKATFQQYAIVPAEIVAKVPGNVSLDEAASVPLGLATVVTALYNHDPSSSTVNFPAPWEEGGATKFAGKPAFILGGASSVGQYAIQMAKLSGFSPVIATASPHNVPLLRSLGASHVLDRSLSPAQIKSELATFTKGKPIEVVYDAISLADTEALAYDALAPGGVLVLVLPDVIPAELKKEGDNKTVIQALGNVHPPQNRRVGVELYAHLTEWLETGELVPNRIEVIPNGLAGIPEGLERLENNKVSGTKLIARPQETP
ncbi:GroES-like protein [Cubamyces sp. BRFM 1775]|nr:GroES-like protein [Cubamyces sp. BRFM 1775]